MTQSKRDGVVAEDERIALSDRTQETPAHSCIRTRKQDTLSEDGGGSARGKAGQRTASAEGADSARGSTRGTPRSKNSPTVKSPRGSSPRGQVSQRATSAERAESARGSARGISHSNNSAAVKSPRVSQHAGSKAGTGKLGDESGVGGKGGRGSGVGTSQRSGREIGPDEVGLGETDDDALDARSASAHGSPPLKQDVDHRFLEVRWDESSC